MFDNLVLKIDDQNKHAYFLVMVTSFEVCALPLLADDN